MAEPLISVVIPTRDEEKNINQLLLSLMSLGTSNYDYEAIVVDDSDDTTPFIAKGLGARVIKGKRQGLGQAIIDGIRASRGDVIVTMDADLSHSPQFIPSLVNPIRSKEYDMTIGSRYVRGGNTFGWTTRRKIISRVASAIAYPITGLHDSSSGYFAFRSDLVDGANLKPDSWKIMLEVLIKTNAKNVLEVPIQFRDRKLGKSKLTFRQFFLYLKHLLKLAMLKFRILNFMLVGFLGYIINMAIYYPLTLFFQKDVTFLGQHFYLPPFALSSFVAITCNYHFNKRWTFNDRQVNKLGYLRYLSMALVTLLLDMFLLFLFVDYGNFVPIVAATLAIAIAFIVRYIIANRWIWVRKFVKDMA